ncbi:sensor histidine kinase [Nocardiopsis terrae]
MVNHGAGAVETAPPGPGNRPGPGDAEGLSPSEASRRFTRRVRRARTLCLWSTALFPLVIPIWAASGLLVELETPADQPELLTAVRALAVLLAAVLCSVATFRMIRDRLDGARTPDRRLYRSTFALLAVVALFLWHIPNVFFICASTWAIVACLVPRGRLLFPTLLLAALPWVSALVSPRDNALLSLLGHGLVTVLWGVLVWLSLLYTVWLWDRIREAVAGEQVRARLAVDGERLRFTNDIRELLGHELGSLELGARRAGGLLRTDPEEAKAEIGRVHELARTTLRQVRSVVRGYRDIDLGTEVRSVRAVLEANGTATTVTGLDGLRLPLDTSALAAWVVREGGTNVLRHSRAHRCRIAFSVLEPSGDGCREVVVEVFNDRARKGGRDGEDSGSGLAGLTERIDGAGGTLTAARTDDGGFLLRVALPLPDGPVPPEDGVRGPAQLAVPDRRTGYAPPAATAATPVVEPGGESSGSASPPLTDPETDAVRGEGVDPGPGDMADDRRVRIARRIIMGVIGLNGLLLVGLAFGDVLVSLQLGVPLWRSVVGTALAVVVAVLLVRLLRERVDGNRQPSPKLFWTSVVLLLAAAVFLRSPPLTLVMIGFWWGTGIFFTSRRSGLLVTLLLLLSPLPLMPTFFDPSEVNFLFYGLVWLAAAGAALFQVMTTLGTVWLWDISREAVAGQRARARLAVTQERLRFARDMHDLLGHSLSALSVKAQLAGRLVDRAPERAGTEIAEVQALAHQALQQVRSAVSGYREVDLRDEVDAVAAVLGSGGTRAEVTGLDGLELPEGVAELAAWVVREGGTNVLRHSEAEACQISFTLAREGDDGLRQLVVEVHNDRAKGEDAERSGGNGLVGLSERVALGGGVLSGSRTRDGGFLLRAIIPL